MRALYDAKPRYHSSVATFRSQWSGAIAYMCWLTVSQAIHLHLSHIVAIWEWTAYTNLICPSPAVLFCTAWANSNKLQQKWLSPLHRQVLYITPACWRLAQPECVAYCYCHDKQREHAGQAEGKNEKGEVAAYRHDNHCMVLASHDTRQVTVLNSAHKCSKRQVTRTQAGGKTVAKKPFVICDYTENMGRQGWPLLCELRLHSQISNVVEETLFLDHRDSSSRQLPADATGAWFSWPNNTLAPMLQTEPDWGACWQPMLSNEIERFSKGIGCGWKTGWKTLHLQDRGPW